MSQYDIAIVGAGPGGYTAAIRAAQLGFKTLLIDKKEWLGGTCLNVGCIPSKTLLRSSELYFMALSEFKNHGLHFKELTYHFNEMQDRRKKVIDQFRKGIFSLLQKNGVTLLEGSATFVDQGKLKLIENGQIIDADRVILATGSIPSSLPHIPFDQKHILSSTEMLELEEVPSRLAIIGGGVIGLEIGSIYSRLGSQVVVIEALDRICPTFDPDLSKEAEKILRQQGLQFHLNQKVTEAKVEAGIVKVRTEEALFEADKLLIAIGRKPNHHALNLPAAGIECDERGFIKIDNQFMTSNPHVFAVGDLVKGPMLAHKASMEGIALVEHLKGKAPRLCTMAIPSVMYSSPEMAQVGADEKMLKEEKIEYRVGKSFFKHQSRAVASHHMEGFVKIIVEKETSRILGCSMIAEGAGEMIHLIGMMITHHMTIEDLLTTPFAHPTLSEAMMEAAAAICQRAIHG